MVISHTALAHLIHAVCPFLAEKQQSDTILNLSILRNKVNENSSLTGCLQAQSEIQRQRLARAAVLQAWCGIRDYKDCTAGRTSAQGYHPAKKEKKKHILY